MDKINKPNELNFHGGTSELKTTRGNQEVVKIGLQIWAKKNLDVTSFRNGDIIPCIELDAEWVAAIIQGQPAWCFNDNDPVNGRTYGKLYNWAAVHDKRGLAPAGWHVPGDEEWKKLTDFLGGDETAGTKMKNTKGWRENGNGDNASGFSALPGSFRDIDGSFGLGGYYGYWWSSLESETEISWDRSIFCFWSQVYRGNFHNLYGFSVRCVKDL